MMKPTQGKKTTVNVGRLDAKRQNKTLTASRETSQERHFKAHKGEREREKERVKRGTSMRKRIEAKSGPGDEPLAMLLPALKCFSCIA